MPTKESLDRARRFMSERQGFRPLFESLALEFDRIAIEAQLRIVNNLKGAERHEWWEMAEKLKAQLAAHNAGEGENAN